MKKLPFLALSLALASAGLSTARAGYLYYRPDYTVETTTTGAWGHGFGVGFADSSHVGFGFSNNGSWSAGSGALTAQFQASAGMTFDSVELITGVGDVIFGVYWGGWASSAHNWTINGSTSMSVLGPTSASNFNAGGSVYKEWETVGTNSGRNYASASGNSAIQHAQGLNTSIYYGIGASSFSIDLTGQVNQGGDGSIVPPGVSFRVHLVPAPPPPSSVPDSGSTMGLMLVALVGMIFTRRFSATHNSAA